MAALAPVVVFMANDANSTGSCLDVPCPKRMCCVEETQQGMIILPRLQRVMELGHASMFRDHSSEAPTRARRTPTPITTLAWAAASVVLRGAQLVLWSRNDVGQVVFFPPRLF